MNIKLLTVIVVAGQALAQNNDYNDNNDRLYRGNEHCYKHEGFPEPSECCTRPVWINRYLVRPCRFSNVQRDGHQQEQESCSVSCGVYRINMRILNNQVNTVRLFRPSRLRGYGDEDWKRAVIAALKMCKKRITSMIGNQVMEGREAEQCNGANDVFADCMDAQLFMQCPERAWIRTGGCDLSKNHLMKGCPYASLTDGTKRRRHDQYDPNDQDDGDIFDDEVSI